jgi:CheY-like chemotaxis protein
MARILIIDDQEAVRRALSRILVGDRHTVLEAADGRQAWEMLATTPVDAILTDVYMPEMDGIEFLVRLKEQAGHIPVIAMSGGGYASSGFVLEDARQLGAAATLEKPFTAESVLRTVRRVLLGEDGEDTRDVAGSA